MANETELLNKIAGPIIAEYNQGSSYPVSNLEGIGLNIINTDTTNSLSVIVTHDNASTTTITVPANTGWSDFVKPFTTLNKSGSSTAYLIQVRTDRANI